MDRVLYLVFTYIPLQAVKMDRNIMLVGKFRRTDSQQDIAIMKKRVVPKQLQ